MHTKRSIPVVPIAALLLALAAGAAGAERWAEHTDPHLGLTFSYPASWTLTPRVSVPGHIGGTIAIQAPGKGGEHGGVKIEIGPYFVEREPETDLMKWSIEYDRNDQFLAPWEVHEISAKAYRPPGDGKSANRVFFRKEGRSPIAEYTYINVGHGRTVWFLWMNSFESEDQAILERVAASLSFGERSPKSLQQLFGRDFEPVPMVRDRVEEPRPWTPVLGTAKISSHYKAPVTGTFGIYCGTANSSLCSGTHKNSAGQAIDIRTPSGQRVYASANSTVYHYAWTNWGYGYHIILRDSNPSRSNYLAYYAHLSWINTSVIHDWLPNNIWRGTYIAKTGATGTGNPGAPHLHFHVRTTGWSAINLSGMQGLSLYSGNGSGFPHCGKSSCAEIGALNNDECKCGQIN